MLELSGLFHVLQWLYSQGRAKTYRNSLRQGVQGVQQLQRVNPIFLCGQHHERKIPASVTLRRLSK